MAEPKVGSTAPTASAGATAPSTPGGPPASRTAPRKVGGLPVWAWVAIGVTGIGVGYIWWKRRKATTSTTSTVATSTASTTSTTSVPAGGGGSSGGGGGGVQTPIQGTKPPVGTPTTLTKVLQTPTTTKPRTLPPTISIGGKTYYVLGSANAIQYNVGGGAPVFFGNGDTIKEGPTAEAAAKRGGGYAYTPITFATLITKAAKPGPAGGTNAAGAKVPSGTGPKGEPVFASVRKR